MARSLDRRPGRGQQGLLKTRGTKRELVGRVTPGDHVEVSREIERLWEWVERNHRQTARGLTAIDTGTGGGGGGDLPDDVEVPELYRDICVFGSGCVSPVITGDVNNIPNNSYVDTGDTYGSYIPVGTILANYAAGYLLQYKWAASGSAVSGYLNSDRTPGDGAYPTFSDVTWDNGTYEDWDGPPSSGFNWDGVGWSSPWLTMVGPLPTPTVMVAGASNEYDMSMRWANNSGFSDGTLIEYWFCYQWKHMSQLHFDIDGVPGSAGGATVDDLPAGNNTDYGALEWNPVSQEWEVVNELHAVARHNTRINSTGTVYSRRRTNFIPGYGVTFSPADDSGNEELDLTVSTACRLNALVFGTPTLGNSRHVIVPRGALDADITFDLERARLRTETPSSSGSVVAILQKAVGGGAPSWVDVGTLTLVASAYEVDLTIGADTVTSDDLLRIYFTSIGTGCTDYQVLITGSGV